MKKIFSTHFSRFLVLVFVTNIAYSQTDVYHPFSTDFTAWQYMNYNGGIQNYTSITWHGDTTINSVAYKKKYVGSVYNGAIRQNIVTQELFYLDEMDVEHNISIPYDLIVGDTLEVDPIIYNALSSYSNGDTYSDSLKVMALDSLLINEEYRKIIKFNEIWNDDDYWTGDISYIIGVGFKNLEGFEFGRQLYCYHVTNNQLWGVSEFEGEFYCTNSVSPADVTETEIFPNPANHMVKISTNGQNFDVFISDSFGRNVFSSSNNPTGTMLDISIFPKGLYFVSIKIENQVVIKKVVFW